MLLKYFYIFIFCSQRAFHPTVASDIATKNSFAASNFWTDHSHLSLQPLPPRTKSHQCFNTTATHSAILKNLKFHCRSMNTWHIFTASSKLVQFGSTRLLHTDNKDDKSASGFYNDRKSAFDVFVDNLLFRIEG